MKRGFTFIELLVVVAMIMILAGAVTSAVMSAQKRAKIAEATTACQEITNAILAYENYVKDGKLPTFSDAETLESNMGFLLGKAPKGEFGEVPVLYNAAIRDKAIRDPWGMPYHVTVRENTFKVETDKDLDKVNVFFPNYFRVGAQ